jgi:hypothetical protein
LWTECKPMGSCRGGHRARAPAYLSKATRGNTQDSASAIDIRRNYNAGVRNPQRTCPLWRRKRTEARAREATTPASR